MTASTNETTYLSCSQAARQCPIKLDPSAVWRWMRQGVVARDGERVYLRHCRVGRRVFTRPEWLERFWEELAEADRAAFASEAEAQPRRSKPATGRDDEARQAAVQRAETQLREAGI